MTIRKAKNTQKEREAIYSLIAEAAKNGKVLHRSRREMAQVIDCFYVAFEQDKIVGCCALEIYSKKLAEIRSLVVLSSHQRKGIGQQLVKECIKEAKKKKVYEILSITDKDSFFEKLGFTKCLNGQWPLFFRP